MRQHVVEMGAFVKIKKRRARVPRKKMPRQLEHVVRVARLARLLGNMFRDRIGRLEIFAVRVAADHVGIFARHSLPEKVCGGRIFRFVR